MRRAASCNCRIWSACLRKRWQASGCFSRGARRRSASTGTGYCFTCGRRSISSRMNSRHRAQTGSRDRWPGLGTSGGARPHSQSATGRAARYGGAHLDPGRQRFAHDLPARHQTATAETADRVRPESRPHAPARADLPLRNRQDAHACVGKTREPNFPPAILSSTIWTPKASWFRSIVPTAKTNPTSSLASSATLLPSIPRA